MGNLIYLCRYWLFELKLCYSTFSPVRAEAILRYSSTRKILLIGRHSQFESMEPEAHQRFLESLGIDKGEVTELRQQFRTAK